MIKINVTPYPELATLDDSTEIAWGIPAIQAAAAAAREAGETTFIRGAECFSRTHLKLEAALALIDELRPEAAEFLGSTAIKPKWFLHRGDPEFYYHKGFEPPEQSEFPPDKYFPYDHSSRPSLLEHGSALVAAVPAIEPTRDLTQVEIDDMRQLSRRYYAHKQLPQLSHGWLRLSDVSSAQVMHGKNPAVDNREGRWYVDVEPGYINLQAINPRLK